MRYKHVVIQLILLLFALRCIIARYDKQVDESENETNQNIDIREYLLG